MPMYHITAKIISRNKGRSAVGSAAYRAGECLYNEYDGLTHDYTRKKGIVYTEIFLPGHIPKEIANKFADRQTLWNAVEKSENSKIAQTAREVEVALPIELSREDQILMLREYTQKNFVDRGMCADIALHDKGDGNPHAHIMLTVRPINKDGTWGDKQKKVYELDNDGNKIYNKKIKTYKCRTEKTTDWDSPKTLIEWREQWAIICNQELEKKGVDERVDHRSYKEQGIIKIPTRHLGPFASKLEKQNILTEMGDINRNIKEKNNQLEDIQNQIENVEKQIISLESYKQRLAKLQTIIDKIIVSSSSYAEFLQQIQAEGYEIKRGKHIAFRPDGEDRFIRSKTLGVQYTEENLIRRIAQKTLQGSQPQTIDGKVSGDKKVSLIIDIENHIKCSQSPGYEHWAKTNNLKQLANTLIFLKENNIEYIDQLKAKTTEIKTSHQQLADELKSSEKQLACMNLMIKNMTTYQQVRPIYEEYQKSVFKNKFYKQHESEMILYNAAKKALDAVKIDGKLPSLEALTIEYAEKIKEKEGLYQEYIRSKKEIKQYDIINSNVNSIIDIKPEIEMNDEKKHTR